MPRGKRQPLLWLSSVCHVRLVRYIHRSLRRTHPIILGYPFGVVREKVVRRYTLLTAPASLPLPPFKSFDHKKEELRVLSDPSSQRNACK
ncbi:hypothetical protein MPNT_20081 [Candidatus Methylacidithermus pantelleriae]|uniref:Uncharacterized protein n=1 Tax=Candidatus Methylacidithermus pantelleriae TaxID=2744239 RepID=A0A8J2FSF3_9BACT|nr:hypothetical protein MPNT_20081 [Candidatus Methylacidithermus pantelleriae]